MIILIILIILVLLSFNLFRNLFSSDVTILDDVKLKEEEPSNNGFALMLEQDDGTYEQSNSSTWPTDMNFNSELSGCIDVNGNIIEDALEYDSTNNIMNVSVGETAYCYVYFDIKRYCNKNETLGECLLRKNSEIDSLNDNIEGGLYRYQGTKTKVNDNYICFGTTDKNTCINNTNKYMYRIIGIDENNQIKLIKNTSIGKYMWHSDNTTNISWSESDLFKGLNGIDGGYYTDLFVNNSTYTYIEEDSNWYNKIATITWKYGDTSNGSYNGETIYAKENGWTNTVNAKIGLMYIHDYYYAYGVGGNPGSYSNAKTAWIFLGSNEWTMSRWTYDGYDYVWYMNLNGYVGSSGTTLKDYHAYLTTYEYAVRSVFYLTSSVTLNGGTGTINDPFLIND